MIKNNKKVFLMVLLICFLTIIVFYLNVFTKESKTVIDDNIVNNITPILNKKNGDSLETINQIKYVEELTNEINNFNSELIDLIGFSRDSISNEIGKFSVKKRNDSKDVDDKINEYLNDIESNQIQINSLIMRCTNINQRLKKYEDDLLGGSKQLSELSFNQYYFNIGLNESGMCDTLNTPNDPFFKMLELARKGNMLSQFLLFDNLFTATKRGLLDVWKYPLDYKNLRDESIEYLRQLAAKGVTRASEKLSRLYSRDSIALPADKVLEYYYSYLALKQEGIEKVFVKNPDKIYRRLSEKQKAIVDRMTENL